MRLLKKYSLLFTLLIILLLKFHYSNASNTSYSCNDSINNYINSIFEVKNNFSTPQIIKLINTIKCLNNLGLPVLAIEINKKLKINKKLYNVDNNLKGELFLNLAKSCELNKKEVSAIDYYKLAIKHFILSRNNYKVVKTSIELAKFYNTINRPDKELLINSFIKDIIDINTQSGLYCKLIIQETNAFLLQNDSSKAKNNITILNKFIEENLIDNPDCYLESANLFLSFDITDAAKNSLEKYEKHFNADNKKYYFIKSLVCRKLNDTINANKFFNKALSLLENEQKQIEKTREKLANNRYLIELAAKYEKNKTSLRIWDIFLIVVISIITIIVIILITIIYNHFKQLNSLKNNLKELINKKESLSKISYNTELTDKELKTKYEEKIKKEIEESKRIINELEKNITDIKIALKNRNRLITLLYFSIRTLLSNIIGNSNILKTELAKKKLSSQYNYLINIESNGIRIMEIINILSDYINIISGNYKANLQPVNPYKIFNKVIEKFKVDINKSGIKLIFNAEKDIYIFADPELLQKAFYTSLDVAIKNAVKGFVSVDIIFDKDNNSCIIKILNTGHGFDKAYLKDITEPFSREGLTYIPGFKGSGMEFPLINKIVTMLNGKLTVDSDIDKGISQIISFSVSYIKKEDKAFKIKKDKYFASLLPWEEKKILIVENDRMNQLIYEKLLSGTSRKVIVGDGRSALRAVNDLYEEGEIFDLIIIEINLPHPWNGIALKDEIENLNPKYKNIPFIAQKEYTMHGDKEKYLKLGFAGYLAKPIIKKELINIISEVFDYQQQ
jgi:signal transduction histidine kinase/CheY-like chemotaxis protein